jgi:ferrochelatase
VTKHRTAVVLFNLGGPDSLAAVQPFLYNLFSDPDIFKFPLAFITQKIFAALISRRRAHEATKGYAAIGGKSPLLENTQAQAIALQLALGDAAALDVYVCMRYWHPLTDAVVTELKEKGYEALVLLPLYPQYSITTTGSSYNEFQRQCRRQNYQPAMHLVPPWYAQPDYQRAIVESMRAELAKFPDPNPVHTQVLFSAHGLPQKVVDGGDPYADQIRATYESVRAKLGWPHTTLCFQSRVGPLEWLRPYTQDAIREKAAAGAKQILVYPIAFVSDHTETLFELGITYADLARRLGVAHYRVTPALNDHPLLIRALKQLVLEALKKP